MKCGNKLITMSDCVGFGFSGISPELGILIAGLNGLRVALRDFSFCLTGSEVFYFEEC